MMIDTAILAALVPLQCPTRWMQQRLMHARTQTAQAVASCPIGPEQAWQLGAQRNDGNWTADDVADITDGIIVSTGVPDGPV